MLIPLIRWTVLAAVIWGASAMCCGCTPQQWQQAGQHATSWGNDTLSRVDASDTSNGNLIKYGLGVLAVAFGTYVSRKFGTVHDRISKHKRETRETASVVRDFTGPQTPKTG